jgi:hypothetical protein
MADNTKAPSTTDKLRTMAVFMGWKKLAKPLGDKGFYLRKDGQVMNVNDVPFNTSYDSLMPVWVAFREKYRQFEPDMNLKPSADFLHHLETIENAITRSGVSETFDLLSEAITWYNSLNKQDHG